MTASWNPSWTNVNGSTLDSAFAQSIPLRHIHRTQMLQIYS
jgi:hypothetical protein